jgi:hypothetical protein
MEQAYQFFCSPNTSEGITFSLSQRVIESPEVMGIVSTPRKDTPEKLAVLSIIDIGPSAIFWTGKPTGIDDLFMKVSFTETR